MLLFVSLSEPRALCEEVQGWTWPIQDLVNEINFFKLDFVLNNWRLLFWSYVFYSHQTTEKPNYLQIQLSGDKEVAVNSVVKISQNFIHEIYVEENGAVFIFQRSILNKSHTLNWHLAEIKSHHLWQKHSQRKACAVLVVSQLITNLCC